MRRHEGQDRGPRSRAPTQATQAQHTTDCQDAHIWRSACMPCGQSGAHGAGASWWDPDHFCGGTVHVRSGAGFSVMKRSILFRICVQVLLFSEPGLLYNQRRVRGGDRGTCDRAEEVKSHEHSLPAAEEVMFEALQNPWFGKSDMRADRQRHTPISYDAVFHIHRWVWF